MNIDFDKAKEEYFEVRYKQWKYLKDELEKVENVFVSKRGGCGKRKYTSGKRIEPYDLSNWRYIEVVLDDVNFLVSLQPIDIDPSSHNKHMLMDRIGISGYVGKYNADTVLSNSIITDIDLPLDDKKIKRIFYIMLEMVSHIKALTWESISQTINDKELLEKAIAIKD